MAFTDATFDFLTRLEKNNNREWFKANQAEFESLVREPALAFIEDMAIWMEAEQLPFQAVAKKVGGSLGRIQRDIRFSNDKTPYKSYVLFHFNNKDTLHPRAGFGIRVGPNHLGIGGGIWQAPTSVINQIRDGIIRDPEGWQAVRSKVNITGEQLKGAPRGYDKEHPRIDDLRFKAYVGHNTFTKAEATGDFLSAVQAKGRPVIQFVQWINEQLD